MQSIDSIKTYAYGKTRNLVSIKGEIKCKNAIKRYKQCSFIQNNDNWRL